MMEQHDLIIESGSEGIFMEIRDVHIYIDRNTSDAVDMSDISEIEETIERLYTLILRRPEHESRNNHDEVRGCYC